MVELRLYVEGGGDSKLLRTACRQGFCEFLQRAGLKGHMPRVVACGSRRQAYDDFCTAQTQKKSAAMLLVDSEDTVTVNSPWAHLLQRSGDQWPVPPGSADDDCHLMVQCMESWFLADRDALSAFFGQGYNAGALPAAGNPIEAISRHSIYQALAAATNKCKTKSPYEKGEHSFKLLQRIDPNEVAIGSPWAARFVSILKRKMGC